MPTPSDLTLTGQALVLAMVNTANPSLINGALSASNVTLGAPSASGSTPNTAITLTATANQGYTGSVTVNYSRLDIATDVVSVLAPSGATVANAAYSTVADLIAPLNSAYNLGLVSDDVANPTDVLSITDGAGTGTVTIAAASLKYTGSLAVTITQTAASLATVVHTTALDGLTPP